jgi:transcriptional regulator with XRE-family HTH domain
MLASKCIMMPCVLELHEVNTMSFLRRVLAKNVKAIREANELTFRQFGEKIGFSNGYCSQVEKEQVKISESFILAVCNAFDVTESELLSTNEKELKKDIPTKKIKITLQEALEVINTQFNINLDIKPKKKAQKNGSTKSKN